MKIELKSFDDRACFVPSIQLKAVKQWQGKSGPAQFFPKRNPGWKIVRLAKNP
jgi:hypothetical protein